MVNIISDYHPITEEEVKKLLKLSKESKHQSQKIAQIRVRISQGIKGITCPLPKVGEIIEKHTKLQNLLVDNYELGDDQKIVNQIMGLLN